MSCPKKGFIAMENRCSHCILPAGLPGVTLDENGKCSYCRDYESHRSAESELRPEKAKERFRAILQKTRGKGKYDCLIPLSGGKESSYILYVLVKEYDLKPLAFNFNNGFQHSQAMQNIENLVNKLGVDLVIYKPDPHMLYQLFRAFLVRAGEFCTPCNMLIDATGYRIAQENDIQAVMSGASAFLDPGLQGVSSALYYDQKYYFEVAKGLVTSRERKYYVGPSYPQKALRRLLGRAPYNIDVLSYLKPDIDEMHRALEEVGWKRPAGAVQHGDCLLNPLKEYIYYKKWGCNEVTALYSVLIREGNITREKGLERALAEECPEVPTILPDFLGAIGITEDEFQEALKRDFHEIPNMRSSLVYQWGKKCVEQIQRIRGRT
jgi:hypothetical protein